MKLASYSLSQKKDDLAYSSKVELEIEQLGKLLKKTAAELSKDEEFLRVKLREINGEALQRKFCPPPTALKIIFFFFTKVSREELIGDLLEEFPEQVSSLGWRLARLWIWKEVGFACFFSGIDFAVNLWERVSPVARYFNSRR